MTSARKLLAAKYKPASKTVRLLLDGELAGRVEAAEAALKKAQKVSAMEGGLVSDVPAATAALEAARAEAEAATTTFVLHAIPGAEFDAMKQAHPPTEAQWESYQHQARTLPMFANAPEFDPDGLAPLLIAASVVEIDGDPVEWDAEDGAEFWSVVHDGARADLLLAAYELNQKRTARPLSDPGTVTTPSSGQPSTTPAATESPYLSLAEGP